MSKFINAKIKTFNKDIEGMKASSAAARARKEVKDLLKIYKNTSVRAHLTKYRKALKSDSTLVLNALRLKKEQQNDIEKAYTKKIAKQQKKLIKIRKYNSMILKAIELLDSNSYAEICSALCFLTGRRMTEILKTAKFTNSKNSKKVMYFKGQLKTKSLSQKYEIYVLGNSKTKCKQALKRLRDIKDTKEMTNLEVSRKFETTVNARVNALFSEFIGRCTAHDLRKAYATICAELHKKKSQTKNSFFSQILGHDEDDIQTANSYQKYYIKKK